MKYKNVIFLFNLIFSAFKIIKHFFKKYFLKIQITVFKKLKHFKFYKKHMIF